MNGMNVYKLNLPLMSAKTAFIFDLNGTIINDMKYHIDAWYNILNELGAGISYEKTKQVF